MAVVTRTWWTKVGEGLKAEEWADLALGVGIRSVIPSTKGSNSRRSWRLLHFGGGSGCFPPERHKNAADAIALAARE